MTRMKGFNKKNVMNSFDLLEKIVEKHKLNGTQTFNVDESGYATVQEKNQKNLGF